MLLVVGGFGKKSQEESELREVSGVQVSRLLDILHLLSILLDGVSIGPRCSPSLGQLEQGAGHLCVRRRGPEAVQV